MGLAMKDQVDVMKVQGVEDQTMVVESLGRIQWTHQEDQMDRTLVVEDMSAQRTLVEEDMSAQRTLVVEDMRADEVYNSGGTGDAEEAPQPSARENREVQGMGQYEDSNRAVAMQS